MLQSPARSRGKFARPPLPPGFVPRPRLMRQLEEVSEIPVTLVAAPAGYGKSTLLTEWLANASQPSTWLSLTERHNTYSQFGSHFIAAITSLFPGSLPTSSGMVRSGMSSNPHELASALLEEIAELPKDFVVVLDDYHLIREDAVHEFVSDILTHMPAPLHLILITRTDVRLPFGKLRAAGQLFELHTRDLVFTLPEAREYMKRALTKELAEDLMQQLYQRAEGWAVGLRFASLMLRGGIPPTEVVERLATHDDRRMMDYLLDEVLSKRTPAVQEFLLKTAVVERFTAPLGNTLLDLPAKSGVYAILDELVRDDLVYAEYDGEETWYKYLDLFRDFLLASAKVRYAPAAIDEVNRRASAWFLTQGMIAEAIKHALAAGDAARAAEMVGEHIQAALDRSPARPQIESWLAFFPAALLDQLPELVMARAWLFSIALKLAPIPPLLARAEQLLDAATDLEPAARRRIKDEIAYHRVFFAYFGGEGRRALELVVENAKTLGLSTDYARGNLLVLKALALQMVGEGDAALQLLTDALQKHATTSPEFTSRLMTGCLIYYLNEGDMLSIESTGAQMLRLEKQELSLGAASAHLGLGLVYYDRNQLEAAAQHFAAAAELSFTGNLRVALEGYGWLAQTQQLQGATAAADSTMHKLLAFAQENRDGSLLHAAEAYRARLSLMQGNVDEALRWAQYIGFNPRPHILFDIEVNLTRLRIWLATRESRYFGIMLEETDALLAVAQSMHSPRRVLQLYALQALARDALGSRDLALESLQQAILLAEPNALIRTFLDLGPAMARLLNLLAADSRSSAFIHRILVAGAHGKRERAAVGVHRDTPAPLIEPLTLRELDVLQGLAQRQTKKEIAQNLVVSVNTVHAHVQHIYQKLGVNDRQQAIQVASAYGIIELSSRLGVSV